MNLRSYTYACLDCRRTVNRNAAARRDIRCQECGKDMIRVIEAPKRRDLKAWKKLRERYIGFGFWTES